MWLEVPVSIIMLVRGVIPIDVSSFTIEICIPSVVHRVHVGYWWVSYGVVG